MVFYPHARVFVGSSRTVDVAGPHIQVLDTTTGDVLHSTAKFPEEKLSEVLKSGPIRCAAVDRDFKYLLTSGDNKMLKLWSLDDFKLVNERELPKRPTSVAFTADAQTLLVSDKFGDIFSYPLTYIPPTVETEAKVEKHNTKDALASHENPSNGQLILGHTCPLNAFILTSDEKYVITADRDEHVRVSWYPKGYNIEMYCLGHLKFVSAIHIPTSNPSSLISGGGDPMLKFWDWMTGALNHELLVEDVVEPFMAVKVNKRHRGLSEEDEATPEGANKPKNKRNKGRKGGKGKEANKEVEKAGGEEAVKTPTVAHDDATGPQKEDATEEKKVLVIHRIDSLESQSGPYIVFSAVGATALFVFPYTKDVSTSNIRHLDFGRPVLDFSIVDGRTALVNLDGNWASEGSPTEENGINDGSMVKVLNILDGKLVEDVETLKSLAGSLNSRSLLPATAESLEKLALYDDLYSLPKYVDPSAGDETIDATQEGSTVLPIGAPELSSSEAAKAKGKGKAELSKKELGRIKTKQAVLAFAMDIETGSDKDKTRKLPEDGAGVVVPLAKRTKSDVDVASSDGGREDDVSMADP